MNGFTREKNLINVLFVVGDLLRKVIVDPMNKLAMVKPYLQNRVPLAPYVAKFIVLMRVLE